MSKITSESLRRLNYVISEINAVYRYAAEIFGLSDSALTVLYSICTNGTECPLSDIYKLSGIPKQTVNSALRKMESEGVLYLEKTDGKSKKVTLTSKGKKLARITAMRLISAENRIAESWADDMEKYIELNRRYAKDLREELESI